jgi:hypothetical protein
MCSALGTSSRRDTRSQHCRHPHTACWRHRPRCHTVRGHMGPSMRRWRAPWRRHRFPQDKRCKKVHPLGSTALQRTPRRWRWCCLRHKNTPRCRLQHTGCWWHRQRCHSDPHRTARCTMTRSARRWSRIDLTKSTKMTSIQGLLDWRHASDLGQRTVLSPPPPRNHSQGTHNDSAAHATRIP